MARPTQIVDAEEVEEIIQLKLKELKGNNTKLSYNNVWVFNKELCEKHVLRESGEEFHLYGYTFWASSYNGQAYLGKQRIDQIKSDSPIIIAGEDMNITEADICSMIRKYKNNPEELTCRISSMFKKVQKGTGLIKQQNRKQNDKIMELQKKIDSLEKSMLTLYYNSQYANNSFDWLDSTNKSGDKRLKAELQNIYKITGNEVFITNRANENKKTSNIFNLDELRNNL